MVIGGGLLASAFEILSKDENTIIFASGVSDSGNLIESEYQREIDKLLEFKNSNCHLVYFSTTGVYDNDRKQNKYIKHKLKIEKIISDTFYNWTIYRLPNVVGRGGNANTMVNFFVNSIKSKSPINIHRNAVRRLIDVDDVFKFVNLAIHEKYFHNQIVNLCSDYFTEVPLLVQMIEHVLGESVEKNIVDKGSTYEVPNNEFNDLNKILNINFDKSYVEQLLLKYIER